MKLVKVSCLFEVHYGVNLDLNKLEEIPMDSRKQFRMLDAARKIMVLPPMFND